MDRYAQLSNNIVVNVIESETDPDGINGEWVACGDAGPGWSYDGTAFHAPEPPTPAPAPRHISVGAFYDRFGAAKWGILADVTPGVVAVIRDASVRAYIDLDNEQLPGGLQIIEAAGHTIDKSAILTAPVLESEKP